MTELGLLLTVPSVSEAANRAASKKKKAKDDAVPETPPHLAYWVHGNIDIVRENVINKLIIGCGSAV